MTNPVSTFAPEDRSRGGKGFIAVAIFISIAALAGFWFGMGEYKKQMLAGEAIDEGRNWAIYLGHNLPRLPIIVGTKKPQDAERRIIESARRAAGIVHFRFLSTDGSIIYSSILQEIGKTVANEYVAAAIAEHMVVGAITIGVDASGGPATYRTAYVPVLDKKSIVGVIEASSDVTARAAQLDRLTLFATAGLAAVMLFIIVLMAIAARRKFPPVALVRPSARPAAPARPDTAAISQAINRVLALMRHELRRPLSGINTMANQLRRHGSTEAFPAMAGALYRSSSALLDLIDTITDPSPAAFDDEPIPFKIKEVVADAIDLLAAPAESRRIHLIDVVSDQMPPVLLGNPAMLTQLLICAVNHGIDMVENGRLLVEVEATNSPGTAGAVEFALAFSGAANARHNPGVDPSVLRRLVVRLGGEIVSDGSDGQLPRFILALPAAAGNLSPEEEPAMSDAEAAPPSTEPAAAIEAAAMEDDPAMEVAGAPSYEESAGTDASVDRIDHEPEPEPLPEQAVTPTLDLSALAALRDEQDGRPGLVERVVANYLEQSPVSLKKLADGVQRGNAPLVQMAANRLKTSSSNIGAARLAELCEHMEQYARTSKLGDAEPLMSEIVTEFTKLEMALDGQEPPEQYSRTGP